MSLTTRIHSSNQAIKQARQVNIKDLKMAMVRFHNSEISLTITLSLAMTHYCKSAPNGLACSQHPFIREQNNYKLTKMSRTSRQSS